MKAQAQISAVVPKKKDEQVRPMHWHSSRITVFIVCVSKAKIVFTVCSEAQSSKVWPKLELESSGHAKPRAGVPFWRETLNGSCDLEPNLEREFRFRAKPWAGALIWGQTSSGNAFEVQNLERERPWRAKLRAGVQTKCWAKSDF